MVSFIRSKEIVGYDLDFLQIVTTSSTAFIQVTMRSNWYLLAKLVSTLSRNGSYWVMMLMPALIYSIGLAP